MCCMFSTESIGDDKKWIWGTARVEASECEESQRNVLKDWIWSGDLLIPFDPDWTNASEYLPVSNHTGRWKGEKTDGQGFSSLL